MKIRHLPETEDVVDYAIGDVHGHLDHMVAALDWCARDAESRGKSGRVHLLGDYVDRGPDSRAVLEVLMEGPGDAHMRWMPVRGNHDHVFASTCRDVSYPLAHDWWAHGGQQTLASYGWDPLRHGLPATVAGWVPNDHSDFLMSLPLANVVGPRLFVHAGVRPGRALDEQTDRDLMWIRSEFLKYSGDFGHVVVHGHSPEEHHPRDFGNRVAMDGGCFYTGRLAVAAFEAGCPAPRFHVVDLESVEGMAPRPALRS
jgi:serine/threonine protein phosphatase 1